MLSREILLAVVIVSCLLYEGNGENSIGFSRSWVSFKKKKLKYQEPF